MWNILQPTMPYYSSYILWNQLAHLFEASKNLEIGKGSGLSNVCSAPGYLLDAGHWEIEKSLKSLKPNENNKINRQLHYSPLTMLQSINWESSCRVIGNVKAVKTCITFDPVSLLLDTQSFISGCLVSLL